MEGGNSNLVPQPRVLLELERLGRPRRLPDNWLRPVKGIVRKKAETREHKTYIDHICFMGYAKLHPRRFRPLTALPPTTSPPAQVRHQQLHPRYKFASDNLYRG